MTSTTGPRISHRNDFRFGPCRNASITRLVEPLGALAASNMIV